MYFVLFFILLDRLFGFVLQSNRPIDYKLFLDSKLAFFESIDTTDILIIGDSHIADALDPRTIENKTSLSTFNLGIYHSSPFENYFVVKAALEKLKVKPRIMVMGTNPIMFERNLSKGKYTPLILPKWKSFDLVFQSDEGFDPSFFSQTIREKYLIKPLLNDIRGQQYKPTRIIEDVYHGHSKFFNQIPATEWSNFDSSAKNKMKIEQIEYFSKTIELALQNGLATIVVHPPIWKNEKEIIAKSESYMAFRSTINQLVEKYNLKVYNDYPNNRTNADGLNFRQSDFLNTQHLNYEGSLKFTEGFCSFLINEAAR